MISQIQAVKYLYEIMPKCQAFLSCSAYLLDQNTVQMQVYFSGSESRSVYYHLPAICSEDDFSAEAACKMFIALLKYIGGR